MPSEFPTSGPPRLLPPGDHFPVWLGMEIRSSDNGCSEVVVPSRPEALNYRGVFHGGIISTVADVTTAVALNSLLRPQQRYTVTQSLDVSFLLPAVGHLTGYGYTVRIGSVVAVGRCEIVDGSGRTVAVAQGNYRVFTLPAESR